MTDRARTERASHPYFCYILFGFSFFSSYLRPDGVVVPSAPLVYLGLGLELHRNQRLCNDGFAVKPRFLTRVRKAGVVVYLLAPTKFVWLYLRRKEEASPTKKEKRL
jgi:hypothetical protein